MTDVKQYVWRLIDEYDNGEIDEGAFVVKVIQAWMNTVDRRN